MKLESTEARKLALEQQLNAAKSIRDRETEWKAEKKDEARLADAIELLASKEQISTVAREAARVIINARRRKC